MIGRTVTLRPAEREDATVIAQWLGTSSAVSRIGARDKAMPMTAASLGDDIASRPGHYFVISDRKGTDIGILEWSWVGSPAARCASIGGAIGDPALWRMGYGVDALDVLQLHLFWTLNAHRVQFTTSAHNEPINMMLLRGGAPVLEAVLRDYYYVDGRYEDAVMWSLLRHEFDALCELTPELLEPERESHERSQRVHTALAAHAVTTRRTSIDLLIERYAVPANPAGDRIHREDRIS